MNADDFDRAAVDLDLYRRATAHCTVSEPHRDADEDVPCSGCLLAAARQLAIPAQHICFAGPILEDRCAVCQRDLSAVASSSSSAVRRSAGGDDGAAGSVPGPPSGLAGGSTPNSNRRERQLPAAESGPVRPQ